jgi:hypothetical protein
MERRVLAVRLVPADVFARLLHKLREENPGAHITAVAASQHIAEADATLDWRRTSGGRLAAELRRHHFDTAVVAHGRDHYATRAYWTAVLLVRLVRAREVLLCEEGRLDRQHGFLPSMGRAVLQVLEELYAAAFALLILLPLLLAAAITDLIEAATSAPAGGAADRT